MFLNTIEIPRPSQPSRARADHTTKSLAAVRAVMPPGFAFTEREAGVLREYLERFSLGDYRVFYHYYADIEMDDVDEYFAALGEPTAAWEPLPGLLESGAATAGVARVRFERDMPAQVQASGCVRLRSHEIVLARWVWVNADEDTTSSIWFFAAPTPQHYQRLHKTLRTLRKEKAGVEWRVVSGSGPGERVPRTNQSSSNDPDKLFLPDRLRERIDVEILRFFRSEAAALYASLCVPYRRGVLLHGPPGNGKTSLIRRIGRQLTDIPGLILRPCAGFDSDDLTSVIRRWTSNAPGVLVIEDLDWLLKQVDVSAFLNLIDGVESHATGGLLLLATTNHPEKLDPAVNNRPGRFDVVIEVPSPDESMRRAYLARHLPNVSEATIRRVIADTDGLAFAHLEEIVRLSGLLAISAGRSARIDEDVVSAAQSVREAYDDAIRGFPGRPEIPFGLGYLRKTHRDEE